MENKTGLEKLLESLVNQSCGCGQGNERYILSGIIDYTKQLIEEDKSQGKKYLGREIADMMKGAYKAGAKEINKCTCTADGTTGWTSVKCCNICGHPTEDFWTRKEIQDDKMKCLGH